MKPGKRKPARKRLTDDEIDDRVFKAVDHIESMLAQGKVTRAHYNDFMADLGRWAVSKRSLP